MMMILLKGYEFTNFLTKSPRTETEDAKTECKNEFEYVCQEEGPQTQDNIDETEPEDSYGAPEPSSSYGAPELSSSYGAPEPLSTYGAPEPSSSYGAPEAPSTSYGIPLAPVLPPARNAKYGERIRSKRQAWAAHPGLDGLFINVNHEPVYGVGREDYGRYHFKVSIAGGLHSTKVAFLLLTQQLWVQFPAFPKLFSRIF